MNVFEDQSFLLRRPPTPDHPLGERVRRSYREIMTGGDEELQFDYPLEYFNVAALGLCAALTQAAFEPGDTFELIERLRSPIDADEFERVITPLRDVFGIDGNIRFLQGPEPGRDNKGRMDVSSLSEMLVITNKKREFLFRPFDWVVDLNQIPLLLFSRATFFEPSHGAGYLGGAADDLPVRTFPIDRSSLRKTIWLNVLSAEQQDIRDFTPADDSKGYNAWMWQTPPTDNCGQGLLTLRAGLFWMIANAFIDIEEIESPQPCIVTGEMIQGRVGTGVAMRSTHVRYGVDAELPQNRLRFFRHPNAPFRAREDQKKGAYMEWHLSVNEVSGLLGNMAGLFFSSSSSSSSEYHVAPVINQLYAIKDELFGEDEPRIDLYCFGFSMLSSKRNVHGGSEYELFHYPLIGVNETDTSDILAIAQGIMVGCASHTESIRSLLTRAVQLCMMVQIDSKENDGHLTFKPKTNIDAGGFVRDIGREFWFHVGGGIQELLQRIGEHGANRDALTEATDEIESWWKFHAASYARTIFERVFNVHCTSPQHLVAAHNARNLFYGSLKNMGISFSHVPSPVTSTVLTIQE